MTDQELEFLTFLEKSIKPLDSNFYDRIEELRKLAAVKTGSDLDTVSSMKDPASQYNE